MRCLHLLVAILPHLFYPLSLMSAVPVGNKNMGKTLALPGMAGHLQTSGWIRQVRRPQHRAQEGALQSECGKSWKASQRRWLWR